MNPEQVVELMRHTFMVALEIALPLLLIALGIGIVISLLQTVTQIQDPTLVFIPKMVALAFALVLFFPWILKIMTRFTHDLLIHQWDRYVG